MAMSFDAVWGPYGDPLQARSCLTGFVDAVCGPGLGVAWASGGAVHPMRAPGRDSSGFGQVVVFEWHDAPPLRRISAEGSLLGRLERTVERALTQIGEARMAQSQAELAMGQAMAQAIGSIRMRHKDDAAGVALDVLCVVLSIGLLTTGVGIIGGAALIGSIILLGTDGVAYGMETAGYDEDAEKFKKATEVFRIAATIMTLPDAAWGGFKIIQELNEVQKLRAASQSTAGIAGTLAERTASAARASQYAQIVERAQRKAQEHSQKLRWLFMHELVPRATVPASVYLLLREELDDENHSVLATFLQRLTFHIITVHS